MMKLRFISWIVYIFLCISVLQAKVTLPAILGNGMVLQQKSKVRLWGNAEANSKVSVVTSWNNRNYEVISDKNGEWLAEVETSGAGGPYQIEISDGEKLLLDDILIGEVWLCSGQSNMEMPMKGFRGQPTAQSQETIVGANPNRNIRLFTVKRAYSVTPQKNVIGSWEKNSPKAVASFSAVGYFFADQLQKILNIPVGIIHASWSGSTIEPWISRDNLAEFPEVNLPALSQTKFEYANGTPTVLYNAMIKPLENCTLKGIIWYQGESNSARPEQYQRLFATWVRQNRVLFRSKELPVYYTEIAPVGSPVDKPLQRAIFREKQLESMYEIPHIGMAFTTDLGSETFIHAPRKREIGQRLAYWALAKTYEIDGFEYSGPIYRSCAVNGKEVEILFDHADDGLVPENEELTGFEIAGPDSVFLPAKAVIINGTSRVKVWNEQVSEPIEVRYCFRNFLRGNLMNNAWLPAISFRIDLRKTNFRNPETMGWTSVTSLGKLPDYIKVYRSPEWIESTKVNAYIAVIDTKKGGKFDVLGNAVGTKKPSEYYSSEKQKPVILLNGGYFAGDKSVSLICRKGRLLADNLLSVTRKLDGKNTVYYPTRSIFGLHKDGSYSVDWIYKVGKTIYAYDVPALNNSSRAPLISPSKGFPKGAAEWKAETAIGAGPVLIKDGTIRNSWVEELYDVASGINATTCQPRSAIGFTGDGKLIFFVCEGREQTPGVPGMTLEQLARLMKSFGCVEALNLDGGGSSCMLVNGKETIKPCDKNNVQRSVATVVVVR